MQEWLSKQNRFTRWATIGTAASAATGMAAIAVFVITLIGVFMLGQRTLFGMTYPPVLDRIGEATLYIIGISFASFLISAVGLLMSLLVGTKTGQDQAGE